MILAHKVWLAEDCSQERLPNCADFEQEVSRAAVERERALWTTACRRQHDRYVAWAESVNLKQELTDDCKCCGCELFAAMCGGWLVVQQGEEGK
jgi:hypothetical protein